MTVSYPPFSHRRRMPHWKTDRARELRANPTAAYSALWNVLRRQDVRWRRQAPMFGYIVDFWCPSQRLIVEIDAADNPKRDADLAVYGIRKLQFTSADVLANTQRVMDAIRQTFAA